MPVSSRLTHARTATVATADAAADARHEASVRPAYITLGLKAVARIATLPFPASVSKAAGVQQLTRSVKTAVAEKLMLSDDRCTAGLNSPSWVPGWYLPLLEAFMLAITPDKPSTADMTTLIDECFRQVSTDVEEGASGPEAFNLLLRRVLVSAVTGSERTLAPGVDGVLEVVRMAVNEQFPSLMPTLYPGPMATGPKPYASLDEMWKAFSDISNNKTPAINGENVYSLPVPWSGVRSSAPSGPRPADLGRGHGRVSSQKPSWQMGSGNNPLVMSVIDTADSWTDNTYKCWPLEEHHHGEVFAVSSSF